MIFTIGIATWNRARLLRQTLESIARLRVPAGAQVELLVCDNNSTDETRAVVESARAKLPFAATYLFEERQGKSFALNRLLQAARGDWIVLTDDDVQVDQEWLEAYARGIARHPDAGCLGGSIHPWLDRPVTGRETLLMREFPYVFGLRWLTDDTAMSSLDLAAWGANMALKRRVIPAAGFMTNRGMFAGRRVPGEDAAMAMAIVAAGHSGWLLPDAVVEHWTPAEIIGWRRFWDTHVALGHTWVMFDSPKPVGRHGGPWWVWRRLMFLRRIALAVAHWRPWPDVRFYQGLRDVAHYWGYLHTPVGPAESK
jgi:glycosyltransferase involved in cell wall biosynthesis